MPGAARLPALPSTLCTGHSVPRPPLQASMSLCIDLVLLKVDNYISLLTGNGREDEKWEHPGQPVSPVGLPVVPRIPEEIVL